MAAVQARYLRELAKHGDIERALLKVSRTPDTRLHWRQQYAEFRSLEDATVLEIGRPVLRRARARIAARHQDRRRHEHPGDLRSFRARYFGERGITYPHMEPWIDLYENPSIKRIAIIGPPDLGRTTAINVQRYAHMAALEAWAQAEGRTIERPMRAAIGSSVASLAGNMLWQVAQYLTDRVFCGDLLDDYGPFKGTGWETRWSATQLYFAWRGAAEKDPSLQAFGIGKTVQSTRLTDITLDDVDKPSNSELERKKILREIDQVHEPRLGEHGRLWYLCNRVDTFGNDVAQKLLTRAQRGTWHAIVQSAYRPDGTALFPERLSLEHLQAKARDLEDEPGMFATVYLADPPTSDGGGIFERERVEWARDPARCIGDVPKGTRRIITLDPAPAGAAGLIVYAVDPQTRKRYVVDLEWDRNPGPTGMQDWIRRYVERYRPERFAIEKVGGSAEFKEFPELRRWLRGRGVMVEELPTGRNKHDPSYGVPALAALFEPLDPASSSEPKISFPYGDGVSQAKTNMLINQLVRYAPKTEEAIDLAIALWKAETVARRYLRRGKPSQFGAASQQAPWITNRQTVIQRVSGGT